VIPLERAWRPGWPCPVGPILGVHRRGAGDPTYRVTAGGLHRRAFRTPDGPVTLEVAPLDPYGEIRARAWGDGAAWALDALPRMLGEQDDPSGFTPPEVLAAAWRRHQHWRLGATGLVWESLAPTVIEQKVTGKEAFGAFRQLVRRFGEPAPGEPEGTGLRLQPTPETVRAIPSWEWLKLPVDGGRSRPLVALARVADSLQRAAEESVETFDRAVRSVGGVGVWTSAEVRAAALGDADAVSFGDYHLGKDVGWALIGEEVDDERVAELLAPYRPHRHRVQHLIEAAGLGRPRRGPRMAPRTHLPIRR
jgi:3-methyladenine DNA glycosylase/8-oxoguanine DNA glycosylase